MRGDMQIHQCDSDERHSSTSTLGYSTAGMTKDWDMHSSSCCNLITLEAELRQENSHEFEANRGNEVSSEIAWNS